MNNSTLGYQLPTFTGLIRHGRSKIPFVRDGADVQLQNTKLETDALVRSGDYFVTLATVLDALGQEMKNNYRVRSSLEDLVSDLIYLQDNYTITKNKGSE